MRDRCRRSYIFSDASIIHSEYVLQALGVRDGLLNLEGCGTSAISIGGACKVVVTECRIANKP
jgi:hypothetical protein